jgi:hypothetical protein
MAAYFSDESDYYYEREWRAIYREGDKFGWVSAHDGRHYFRFDAQSIRYVIVPEEFLERALDGVPSVVDKTARLEIVAFEKLASGDYDE